jgi:hypothetical protein
VGSRPLSQEGIGAEVELRPTLVVRVAALDREPPYGLGSEALVHHGAMRHLSIDRGVAASLLAAIFLGSGCSSSGCGGGATPPPSGDPGALIRTSMAGQVGVLLDELPEALRDKEATALMAKPADFWVARARRQMRLTLYRLVFRPAFYDGKGQLPLPPVAGFTIALDPAGPSRIQFGGHDVIAVHYTYTSTLLSDPDSPEKAEPALAKPGGVWDEAFVLPIDPELLFQRTGYACMDEDEFPPNSVDGENADTFYDDSCTVAPPDCHVTLPMVTEDCQAALDAHVGKIEAAVHFERLAWDEALAREVRIGEVTHADSADLAVIGDGLDNHRIIYRYIPADSCAIVEGCVGGTGWRRLLQFDASVENLGGKALDIGDVDYFIAGYGTTLGDHHIYEYSACHNHYHFSHYGDFDFGSGAEQPAEKRAFCLQSTSRYSNNESSPLVNPYASCAYQGMQAGWGDDYIAGLDCQWIDVTAVDTSKGPVTEPLTFVSNPDQFLCEGTPILDAEGHPTFVPTSFKTAKGEPVDRPACTFAPSWDMNNTETREVTLPSTGGLTTAPCTRGQIGPLRDCGFIEQKDAASILSCKPGEKMNLACSIADTAAPAVLRVCERSSVLGTGVACTYRDALANQTILDKATVSLTCPSARDGQEPGGLIALYAAPVLPEDKPQPIACVVAP